MRPPVLCGHGQVPDHLAERGIFRLPVRIPVHPQQWALRFLDRALKEAFDKSSPRRFPEFGKKGRHDSLRYPDPEQTRIDLRPRDEDGRRVFPRIFLPRIGWVKFRRSCIIGGEIRNVTVSRSGGHWTAAIQTGKEIPDPVPPSATAVGGDRGVGNLLTLSDGTMFLPVTAYRDLQKRLAREQRKLAHKVKFSANRKQQKAKVTRLHQSIPAIRKNVLHQVSTILSKNHAVVVLEDLKVRNMTGSGRGAADAGNRKGAVFRCLHCGHEAHADVNAAKNILARRLQSTTGHAGVACFAA